MNLKKLVKKIFASTIEFLKDGIKFWLKSCEKSYELELHRIKKLW